MKEFDLMTYGQVSKMLGIPRGTLYAWVFERRVPHVRLGKRMVRFSRQEICDWVVQKRVEPETDVREAG